VEHCDCLKCTSLQRCILSDWFFCHFSGQALLATKAVNEKARTAAYSLLVEIGQSYMRWHPELTQQGCSVYTVYSSYLCY